MDITVAVCARNAENTIADCINSINNQTVKPDRILLIDDHSTDQTRDIASKLDAEVISNEGRQLYDGRNTALKNCNTQILAFTDSDCILDKNWVANIIRVFSEHDNAAAGTGPHPPIGTNGFAGWLHHMWFLVETDKTGFTGGIIGGNSYFKTEALDKIGGWPSLPFSNAEDVYISIKLIESGYKLWFDESIIANHKYADNFLSLMKKTITSGKAITYMMKTTGIRKHIWIYTLAIPFVAVSGLISIVLLFYSLKLGLISSAVIFGGTFIFLWYRFRTLKLTIPRFLARWILIWPYAWGILKGLKQPNP